MKSYVAQLLEDYRGCFTVNEIGEIISKETNVWPLDWQVQEVCNDLRDSKRVTTVDYGDNIEYFEFIPKCYQVRRAWRRA